MKILRIFGLVAAGHFFAFIFIMANPGCSTKSKTPVAAAPNEALGQPSTTPAQGSPFAPSPLSEDAPSEGGLRFDSSTLGGGNRFAPTRPGTSASLASAVPETKGQAEPVTVTVSRGDSLWSISRKHGVSVNDLAAINKLKTSSVLRVGQKLTLPEKPSASSLQAPDQSGAAKTLDKSKAVSSLEPAHPASKLKSRPGTVIHIVKRGEMLGSIARKYGVKARDIAVTNNITNPAIIPVGKELIIVLKKDAKAPVAAQAEAAPSIETPSQSVEVGQIKAEEPSAKSYSPFEAPLLGETNPLEDLDAGLAPQDSTDIPVIKIEEAPPKN